MPHMKCVRVFLLILLAATFSWAQTPTPPNQPAPAPAPPAPAPPAPPAWSAGPIDFSGLVDGYYSANFNHPASGTNVVRNFDVRANSLSLNYAELVMEHNPDPIGFRVDIGFGRTMEIVHGTEPYKDGAGVMRHIQQAYLSVKPKNGGGFQFDFGKFVTSAGAEVIETHSNWNYSRSLLFAWAIPYYHFGARLSKPVNSVWTTGFQLVNGWNNVEDNNTGKTIGVTNAFVGKKAQLFNVYYVGPEKTGTNQGYRHLVDTNLVLTPNDKFNMYVNYDYAVDRNKKAGDSVWSGIAVAARLAPNSWFALIPRVEYFSDRDGFSTGTAQKLKEFTMTAEFKHSKGFLTRAEYRRDWSDKRYFDRGNQTANSKTQDTFLLGFVVYFGPK